MKYRKAVFILAYALNGDKPEFLILKRKLHWKGWEFPKGGIERGETQAQSAKRELHEETGLKPIGRIRKFDFSGEYPYGKILPDRLGFNGQTYTLYAAQVKKGKISLDKKEHSGHKWVSYKEALKKLRWEDQRESLKIVNGWLESELEKR